jgi:hypothetical protein
MLIAFVHEYKAFLPEIAAYRQFFERYGIETVETTPNKAEAGNARVEWRFMGRHTNRSMLHTVIHEYASASLPPFRKVKDYIKRKVNVNPDFRLFLNPYVRQQLSFGDAVPFGFRDMGIYPDILQPAPEKKIYDFIYLGSVSKDMAMDRLLKCFTKPALREKSLLVLSKNYELLRDRFSGFPNIIFKGPVPQQEVYVHIRQSKFAINYKPDIAPHNEQTSTKFLEYAACQTPIITTDFAWMRHFTKQFGGNYFFLEKNLANLSWENVNNFQYSFPDMSEWIWEKQIRRSGVLEFLQKSHPRQNFGI